jgi:hypothetical protein
MPDLDRHTGELNPEVHHEHKDVNVRMLFWFVAVFIVFTAVTFVAVWGMYSWLAKKEREAQPQPTTMVRRDTPLLPPEPRLQPFPAPQQEKTGVDEPMSFTPVTDPLANTPVADMDQMIADEAKYLGSYGWLDRKLGIVRIPVSEAKKIIVARGLPVRQPVAAVPATVPAGVSAAAPGTGAPPGPRIPEIKP